MLTTTAIDVGPELLNLCIVLSVDEGTEQTRAIHERQRAAQTLQGLLAAKERETVAKLYCDAQRLIEPIAVVNPFAPKLSFPDRATRSRRDHAKYLSLIRSGDAAAPAPAGEEGCHWTRGEGLLLCIPAAVSSGGRDKLVEPFRLIPDRRGTEWCQWSCSVVGGPRL